MPSLEEWTVQIHGWADSRSSGNLYGTASGVVVTAEEWFSRLLRELVRRYLWDG